LKTDVFNLHKFVMFHNDRSYRGLEARITLWDPLVLKQIQIKQFSKFSTRQVSSCDALIN